MRERGMHEKPGEIKKSIIEYLLTQNNGIDEPTLRDYIKTKFDISENKTIKNHLKDLLEQECIKKYYTSGKANHWGIEDIVHLQNINHNYPDILHSLIKSPLSINIIAESCFYKPNPSDLTFFKNALRIPSFYNLFLNNNIEDIYNRASVVLLLSGDKDLINFRDSMCLSKKELYIYFDRDIIGAICEYCAYIDLLNNHLPDDLLDYIGEKSQIPINRDYIGSSLNEVYIKAAKDGYFQNKHTVPILTDYLNKKKIKKLLDCWVTEIKKGQ